MLRNCFTRASIVHKTINPLSTSCSGRNSTVPSLWQSRRSYIVLETAETPNPECLKFFSDEVKFMPTGGNFEIRTAAYGKEVSPLAGALFSVSGVAGVHFGDKFLTITRSSDSIEWKNLNDAVTKIVSSWVDSGEPLFTDESLITKNMHQDTEPKDGDSEVVLAIKELIEYKVRPKVMEDGGNIQFVDYDEEEGMVFVRLQGSCADCPSSTSTLHDGIERLLMHYVPEVAGVQQITPHPMEFPESLADPFEGVVPPMLRSDMETK